MMRRLVVEVLVDCRRLAREVRAATPDAPAGAHEERIAFETGVDRSLRVGAFALQRVEDIGYEGMSW